MIVSTPTHLASGTDLCRFGWTLAGWISLHSCSGPDASIFGKVMTVSCHMALFHLKHSCPSSIAAVEKVILEKRWPAVAAIISPARQQN